MHFYKTADLRYHQLDSFDISYASYFLTILFELSFIWVILFELDEVWWISKNGENGFESDDLWFQQLRLSCHFLTNWFELFWFIMLKDTRHPTYTSCPIWNPALSVYATNINHLIHENLNSIHENTTTDRKFLKQKKMILEHLRY